MRKIINIGRYFWESFYPYLIAGVIVWYFIKIKLNIMGDKNYSDLLDGLVTLISIIIGFLGAMLPIVLILKENSEFVQYIFKEDREKLFYKYMKEMFLLGVCDAALSLLQHVHRIFLQRYQMYMYYSWIFITIAFFAATYRAISYMLKMIFIEKSDENEQNEEPQISENQREEIRQEFKNKP